MIKIKEMDMGQLKMEQMRLLNQMKQFRERLNQNRRLLGGIRMRMNKLQKVVTSDRGS